MKSKFIVPVALSLMVSAAPAFTATCPSDFISILESDEQTNLFKRKLADNCKGTSIKIDGKVIDIDEESHGNEPQKNIAMQIRAMPKNTWYEVHFKKDHLCPDLLSVKKGQVISIVAEFVSFDGYGNRYMTFGNAMCKS
jgi:hypothetical protein